MEPAVVGVDVGTGAARAVALSPSGAVLGTAERRYRGAEAWPPGRADPRAWLAALLEALAALGRRAPAAARAVAVAVGGQSPTTVPASGGLAVTVRHPVGNQLDNAARHQAQRSLVEAESGEPVIPRQVWDWLLEQLGAEPAQGRWPGDPELPGFGPLRRTGEVVGCARGGEVLAGGTLLVTGAQDAFLACWAAGVDVPGRGLDPGGRTGGLAVAVPAGFSAPGLWSSASAAGAVDIAGGAVNAHGITLEWLARLLGASPAELAIRAADAPIGAGGLLLLPYLEGERAPRWESGLRGLIAGLHAQSSVADLARAVLEGTACGLAHVAEVLRETGARLDVLVCAGSPSRSALWCGIKAAVLDCAVEVPDDPELAAYGAALAAGAGAQWWPRPGDGASRAWPRPAMRPVPAAAPAADYRDLYRRFVAAGDLAQSHLAIFGHNPPTAR